MCTLCSQPFASTDSNNRIQGILAFLTADSQDRTEDTGFHPWWVQSADTKHMARKSPLAPQPWEWALPCKRAVGVTRTPQLLAAESSRDATMASGTHGGSFWDGGPCSALGVGQVQGVPHTQVGNQLGLVHLGAAAFYWLC